jgi:superfamily II DNA or RNA helicase
MSEILVAKVNEVYIKIFCPDHVSEEIYQYFTFMAPDHEWSPSFKARHWDGKIRLFNKKTKQLYSGLIRYLISFAVERKYKIEFEKNLGLMNNFSLEEAKEYIDSLKITSRGKLLEARDYQITGLAKAIRYKRMLMLSPTASGKSFMIYAICRYLLSHDCSRGLIIVPTIGLVEQMQKDFIDYADSSWDAEKHTHKIYQGQNKNITVPITISTWQSIYDMKIAENPNFFTKFDFVIGDEAHTFKANSLKAIMTKLVNAQYRIGTTGTLDNWEVHKLTVEGFFGPVSKLTTTKKMIDEKQAADLQIKCLILRHPQDICNILRKTKDKAYQVEIDYLIGSSARNKFLRNLALSLNGNTLLLFQYVEKHGELLQQLIKEKAASNRQIFYIHGGTDVEDRESVRTIVEKETDAIIVASYGVFSTGVNIRNLHNIIFASPSKSKIRVLQSIGRGLRMGDTKTSMTLYDISDDLRIDGFVNYTLKHFAERVKIYRSEQFKISNYTIELK